MDDVAMPSTPMQGPARRQLAQQPEQAAAPDLSGYVVPSTPETLANDSHPLGAFGMRLLNRRRLTPDFGRRRL